MTCKSNDDSVYKSLMNQRTENDKQNISKYNCSFLNVTYPKSLVSMLEPNMQATFRATNLVDPNVLYQLNPTSSTLKYSKGLSSKDNTYPPSCGFGQNLNGCQHNPDPYYHLSHAYDPTSGPDCINLGQDLNLQYVKK